jgi:WD40 repeat protein/serine/threonine protein kinase
LNPLILRRLAQEAPTPLFRLAERAQNECAPERQHHNTYYIFELWLRLAVAVIAAQYRSEPQRFPHLDKALRALTRPSVGALVSFVRAFTKTFESDPFSKFWECKLTEPAQAGYSWVCQHAGVTPRKASTIGDLAESVAAYRNKTIGHGALHHSEFYRRGASIMFDCFGELVLAGTAILDGRFLAVENVAVGDSGRHLATVFELLGSIKMRLVEPMTDTELPGALRGRTYFSRHGRTPLPLFPWIVWETDSTCVLNKATKAQVEYLNYYTGEILRHGTPHATALHAILGETAEESHDWSSREDSSVRVVGEYEVVCELGRGGMGTVFLARHRATALPVAIKVLPKDLLSDADALARFEREIDILKHCEHPHIVSPLTHGLQREDGAPYYAMELVVGWTLAEIYAVLSQTSKEQPREISVGEVARKLGRRRKSSSGPEAVLPDVNPDHGAEYPVGTDDLSASASKQRIWDTLLRRFAEVADALHYLHCRGIVHRDVKPSNLMITEDFSRALVMDLGVAKLEAGSIHTRPGSLVGTLRYSSREQIVRSLDELDFRTDLYSLGATMYEVFSGRPLYADTEDQAQAMGDAALLRMILDVRPTPVRTFSPDLYSELEIVLEKLLEKQPQHRFYNSAAELAEDLRAIADQRPIRAKSYTEAERRAFELYESLRVQAARWDVEQQSADLLWGEERVEQLDRLRIREEFELSNLERAYCDAALENAIRLKRHRVERAEQLRKTRQSLRNVRRLSLGLIVFVLAFSAVFAALQWRASDLLRAQEELARREAEKARNIDELARAASYVAKGQAAELQNRLDEAVLYFSEALQARETALPKETAERALEGIRRESNAPIRTRLRWSAKVGHSARSVALSRDSRWVAIAGDEPHVVILAASDCSLAKTIPTQGYMVTRVEFSPSNDDLAVGTASGSILIIDPQAGVIRQELVTVANAGKGSRVVALTFAPDGKTVVAGFENGSVARFVPGMAGAGEVLIGGGAAGGNSALARLGAVNALSVSRSGTVAAVSDGSAFVELLSGVTSSSRQAPSGDNEPLFAVAYVPGEETLVVGGADNALRVVSPTRTEELGRHGGDVLTIDVSEDGDLVASGGEDNLVRLWSRAAQVELRALSGFRDEIQSLALDSAGRSLAVATSDGVLDVFDVERSRGSTSYSGELLSPILGHKKGVEMIAFSSDGVRLVSSAMDDTVRVWDPRSGRQLISIPTTAGAAVAVSGDGSTLAAGMNGGQVGTWRVSSGEILKQTASNVGRVASIAFAPDGRCLAFGGKSGGLGVWCDGVETRFEHHAAVNSVQFSPDGATIATASGDRRILLWNTETLEVTKTLGELAGERHNGDVYEVAFSPSGKLLASGSRDGSARLWDVQSGRLLRVFKGHQDRVYGVSFSPDGSTLASASKDMTVRLWNVTTGEERAPAFSVAAAAYTARFAPDGKRLASCGEDRAIHFFDLATGMETGWVARGSEERTGLQARTGMVLRNGFATRAPPTCVAVGAP